jgi:hypothetical protein
MSFTLGLLQSVSFKTQPKEKYIRRYKHEIRAGQLGQNCAGVNINTCSAREYTMFAPEHILRNWREQRPSSKADLDPSVTG